MLQDQPLHPHNLRIDQRSEITTEFVAASYSDQVEADSASVADRSLDEEGYELEGAICNVSPPIQDPPSWSHRYHRQSTFDQQSEQEPKELENTEFEETSDSQDIYATTSYSNQVKATLGKMDAPVPEGSEVISRREGTFPTSSISDPCSAVLRRSTFEQSAPSDTHIDDDIELNVDFQQELEGLESLILDSVRIPLTELVVIDEGLVLDRLDSIRQQIPRELEIAKAILQHNQEILKQAEDYARNLIESAKKQANRIIQESALVRQAELEATRIKIEAQRESEQLRQKTQEEIEYWRELAIAEYEDIQNGADDYARNVLGNLEGQLSQMLAIIHNGYQQLEAEKVQDRANNHQE